jgi:hypothetical protein
MPPHLFDGIYGLLLNVCMLTIEIGIVGQELVHPIMSIGDNIVEGKRGKDHCGCHAQNFILTLSEMFDRAKEGSSIIEIAP